MIIWHYTTSEGLVSILSTRELETTAIGITRTEKPILWFSSNQRYEWAAYRADANGQPFTFYQHIERFGGFVRFGIPLNIGLEIFPWEGGKLADEARIPPDERTRLEKTAKPLGANPDEWYGVLKNVPVSSCASIQILNIKEYNKSKGIEWIDICETIKC
jgi:hypothetical protein